MNHKNLVSYLLVVSIAMGMAMSAQGATVINGGWRFVESLGHAQDFDVHEDPNVHPTWYEYSEHNPLLSVFNATAVGSVTSGQASSFGSAGQLSTISPTLIAGSGASAGTVTITKDHGQTGNSSELSIDFSVDTPTPFLIQGSISAIGSNNVTYPDTDSTHNYSASVNLSGVTGASWQLSDIDGDIPFFSLSGTLDIGSYTIAAIADGNSFIDDPLDESLLGPPWVGMTDTAFDFTLQLGAVPLPPAVWLFGSGLVGLIGITRKKKPA